MANFRIEKKDENGLPLFKDDVLVDHFKFIIDALRAAQELGATEVNIWDPGQDDREGNQRAVASLDVSDNAWKRTETIY